MGTKRNRDDFSAKVIEQLARRAAYTCSNPNCRRRTLSPSSVDPSQANYVGVAAHITAAALNGPRYDSSLSPEQRQSIENAIHLCATCSVLIDKNDGIDYPATMLREWKAIHEEWLRKNPSATNTLHTKQLTLDNLLAISIAQADRSLKGFSQAFTRDLYVMRDAEADFEKFMQSDKICFVIVDRAGRGKTNLLCNLALRLQSQQELVILLTGNISLIDDHSLERVVAQELGSGGGDEINYQGYLNGIGTLLAQTNKYCYVLLDGVSESDDLRRMNRSVKNLLLYFSQIKHFKLCLSCRDVLWPIIGRNLPEQLLYSASETNQLFGNNRPSYEILLGDFSDAELDIALARYFTKYDISFTLSRSAREQLKHPLLLRIFCETNYGKKLGLLNSIPVSSTFNEYLSLKTNAVATRASIFCDASSVLRLLLNIAGQSWEKGNRNAVPETDTNSLWR